MVHVPSEYDYMYQCKRKSEAILNIQTQCACCFPSPVTVTNPRSACMGMSRCILLQGAWGA